MSEVTQGPKFLLRIYIYRVGYEEFGYLGVQ